jgi:hypothetical protein
MRGWYTALVVLVACSHKAGDPNACPGGVYDLIPPDCDDVNCENIICDAVCPMGQTCPLLDCKDSPQCRLDCQGSADCTYIDCDQSDVCFIDCHDSATCEVSCLGAQDCTVGCETGAACLVHCGPASGSACRFDMCDGSGMTDCGSGVIVCNRPCP